MHKVKPLIKSPIKRRGGKSKLVSTLLPLVPPHTCYVEVFGGAGHLLFGKAPSKVEVFNDLDDQLFNLFNVAKHKHEELAQALDWMLPSRTAFNLLKTTPPKELADVDAAARYYYLMRSSFAGRLDNPTFGISKVSKSRFDPIKVKEDIRTMYERLASTACYLECLDFEAIIKKYDGPETFFYLDPPYHGTDGYELNMSHEDHVRLRNLLSLAKGKWLLSINYTDAVQDLYEGCEGELDTKVVNTFYSSSNSDDGRGQVQELLIANYNLHTSYVADAL